MKKALVVGIDDYPGNPLAGCINDATAVEQLISSNEDGSPNMEVRLLTSRDQSVTKVLLGKLIDELFRDPADMAFFYFSGHGLVNNAGGYLVTSDARSYDEGLLMSQILNLANQSPVKDIAIVLDCCYSGKMGSSTISDGQISSLADGLTIMTASRDSQVALESGGHGVFTSLFAEALAGGAADLLGNITPGAVYAYIDGALGAWGQRPIFKTNVSKFSSWRSVVPRVPVATLRKICTYFETADEEHRLDKTYEETEPEAIPENVLIFKDLQKFVSVGLVKPIGEDHMYWAAMHKKSCGLTAVGRQYWRLADEKKF